MHDFLQLVYVARRTPTSTLQCKVLDKGRRGARLLS